MNHLFDNCTYWLMATVALGLLMTDYATAGVVDFEDLTPGTSYKRPDESDGGKYWNGSDGSGGFTSRGTHFSNTYSVDPQYGGSWSGWSYSNTSDVVTKEYTNQYSAFTGKDHTEPLGVNYGVYYEHRSVVDGSLLPSVTLTPGSRVRGVWVTNTTYAALSMLNGDGFAKKFGGADGNDADWFLLSISGTNSLGTENSVHFYLADYRFADNSRDYVVNEWKWVDLSPLGDATQLAFDLSSSDEDPKWGMNTPAFFALDDMTVVPEPGTIVTVGFGMLLGSAFLWRRKRTARAK